MEYIPLEVSPSCAFQKDTNFPISQRNILNLNTFQKHTTRANSNQIKGKMFRYRQANLESLLHQACDNLRDTNITFVFCEMPHTSTPEELWVGWDSNPRPMPYRFSQELHLTWQTAIALANSKGHCSTTELPTRSKAEFIITVENRPAPNRFFRDAGYNACLDATN